MVGPTSRRFVPTGTLKFKVILLLPAGTLTVVVCNVVPDEFCNEIVLLPAVDATTSTDTNVTGLRQSNISYCAIF